MSRSKDIIDKINLLLKDDQQPNLVLGLTEQVRNKVEINPIVEGKTCNHKGVTVRVDSARPEMNIPRHAHTNFKSGQISYTDTGQRYHPGKFPNQVPRAHKDAIRWALNLEPSVVLEGTVYYSDITNELFILLEEVNE